MYKKDFVSISENLIFKFNQNTRKFENIFPLICSADHLQKVWRAIRCVRTSLIWNKTFKFTCNYLDVVLFKKISKQLKLGRYKYSSARQVAVFNKTSFKKKVIVFFSLYDKIIQKAFFFVLQSIFKGVAVWQSVDFSVFKTCLSGIFTHLK